MADYNFTRTFSNGKWNINNPNDVDGNGISVPLSNRIEENGEIGIYLEGVNLNPTEAVVHMSQSLTSGEETTLNNIVSTHEAANGSIDQSTYLYLTSSDGTTFKVGVSDLGDLTTESV